MRFLAPLLLVLLLAGCGGRPALRAESSPRPPDADAQAEYLMDSAVADFAAHRPPYPAAVRNVRLGFVVDAQGARQYLISGDFMPAEAAGADGWVPFVTIRTSGYEQWLGGQAAAFCREAPIVWLDPDLSGILQGRLDPQR